MATGAQLVGRLESIVTDASYDSDDYLSYLNEAHQAVAGGIQMPNGSKSPPLPDLAVSYDIDTSTSEAYVAMPTATDYEYQRDLFFVSSEDQDKRIQIYESWIAFLSRYPRLDEAGFVEAVCVKGQRLYYNPIPASAETLTLHYYKKPATIASGSTDVVGVPAHLQYRVLCSYAAWQIYDQIENDVEAKKRNTKRQQALFYSAMEDMIQAIDPPDGEASEIVDDNDYTDGW